MVTGLPATIFSQFFDHLFSIFKAYPFGRRANIFSPFLDHTFWQDPKPFFQYLSLFCSVGATPSITFNGNRSASILKGLACMDGVSLDWDWLSQSYEAPPLIRPSNPIRPFVAYMQ